MKNTIIGSGCPSAVYGLPEHNPAPSTVRGKRRHEKRNAEQKKYAENKWGQARSIKKVDDT